MDKRLEEALAYYISELKRRFPAVEIEVSRDAIDGSDAWVRVTAPDAQTIDVVDATAELDEESYRRFSVGVLATVSNSIDTSAV